MLDDVHRRILAEIASYDSPVGQGTIGLALQKQGLTVSIPTIGRRLQELEFGEFIEKVGVQGRILTERGREALDQLRAEDMLRRSGDALLQTLNGGDRKRVFNLLSARRILEGPTAALAAERATPETIATLESLVEEQTSSVRRGDLGVEQDVTFHEEIARASGNPVLASLVSLLRKNHHYNLAIISIRTAVGGRLVVDHAAILDAIKRRDSDAARAAMERHLDTLANDLNRYWKETTSSELPLAASNAVR